MEKVRIQKYISDAGVASRRAAEAAIAEGEVTVNGKLCETGQKVDDGDIIVYRGKLVKRSEEKKLYIMINKPRGVITTNSDESGRKCVAELVTELGVRLYPVGRLDRESEGLLLMTNDGEFANAMTHPSHEVPKIYNVKVRGQVSDSQLATLRSPLTLEGYTIKPVQVDEVLFTGEATLLRFRLFEGRNRQIRRMCEAAGLHVMRLTRIAIGDIAIGNLKPGQYRDLTPAQLDYLKKNYIGK